MPSPWSRLDVLKDRAKLAREQDQLPLAIQLFKVYLRHRDTDGYAWLALGDCQRVLGRLRTARRCFRQAQRHAPIERRYLVEAHLATTYANRGHHRRAESLLRSACAAHNEQLEWIWLFRGQSYAAREKWRAAEDCFARAIEIDPGAWEAYYELGAVLRATRRYDAAQELFELARERAPNSTEVQQAIQSLVDWEQASRIGIDDEATMLQHWDEGHAVCVVEALERTPHVRQDERTLLLIADALRSLGRSREALHYYSDALRLDHHDALMIFTGLAAAFKKIGSHSRAAVFYAKAALLPEASSYPWLWVLRGENLTKRGRFKRANTCYRQAIRINATYDEAYLNLGLNLLASGRYQHARRYLGKAQSLDNTPAVREALASLENAEHADQIAQDVLREDL